VANAGGTSYGSFVRAAKVVMITAAVIASLAAAALGSFVLLRHVVVSGEEPRRPPSDDYQPVATDLALLAQTLDAPLSGLGHAWLPKSARELRPTMAVVQPNGASLGWGRDYGGSLVLSRGGDVGETTTWVLVRRDQKSHGEVARVTLPRDRKIPLHELIERTQTVYAERIASGDNDHFSRVGFALRFQDMAAVRALLADSVKRAPERPEPRMALAFVDAWDRREDGIADIERWAKERPSYARWSDVALTHMALGPVDPAIAAMNEALRHPLVVDGHHTFNASACALPIATLALAEARFEAVESIASRVQNDEPEKSTRAHFAPDFRALRAAAAFRAGDHTKARALVDEGIEPPDPANRLSDDPRPALAAAIRASDSAAVDRWRPKNLTDIVHDMVGGDLLGALRLDRKAQ
jgi:hypothetical protein